jgi:Barstar (barnase inhibitor)
VIRTLRLDGSRLRDWPTFHDTFARALGFPDFYGRNQDAWIDCMTCLDEPGFCTNGLEPGNLLLLQVAGADADPILMTALLELSAIVNHRRLQTGQGPILILSSDA